MQKYIGENFAITRDYFESYSRIGNKEEVFFEIKTNKKNEEEKTNDLTLFCCTLLTI